MDTIEPRDRGEEIAVFRAGIIGSLAHAELARGELKRRMRALSREKFRPPGSDRTRTYGVSTLQRWYYAYKNGGLEALKPKARADRGHGRELTDELKELLLDIRREHRHVPATVIRDTLILEGRMDPKAASVCTIQRLYREHNLSRLPRGVVREDGAHRLRWEAPHPGALWHGDVCHGPALTIGGERKPLRIHALLDDASRYGLEAKDQPAPGQQRHEREHRSNGRAEHPLQRGRRERRSKQRQEHPQHGSPPGQPRLAPGKRSDASSPCRSALSTCPA